MRASPSSSEASSSGHRRALRRGCRWAAGLALSAWLACALPGCVTVRPEEREYLADPAMTFGSGGEAEAHESHVLSNREGSYGASGAVGGGCGCN